MKDEFEIQDEESNSYIRVTSNGQIVIPARMLTEMQLTPGTPVAIRREGTKIVLQPITREFIRSVMGLTKGLNLGDERRQMHCDDKER